MTRTDVERKVTYIGRPSSMTSNKEASVTILTGEGKELALTHHRKHSPDGFAWGYDGSGPAELARCILIDHYGGPSELRTRAQHAPRDTLADPEAPLPVSYQEFKREVIAAIPTGSMFELSSDEVQRWIDSRELPDG